MAILNKNNLKDIKEVLTTNVYINDKCVDITIKCWLNYGVYEEYTVARVYDSYTMTYINGIEKEYKRRKAALNAILKAYNTINKMSDILNFKEVEIVEVKEETENNTIKEDKIIRIKIKLLDSKINRLLDKRYILRDNIIKQGIKFNDIDNDLIKELNSIDNILDRLEDKIDTLKEELREVNNKQYKEYLGALKEEYGNNKYKIIDNKRGSITYTNDLKDYLYNNNYTIKLILDNKEVFKQYINNKKELYGNSYIVLEFNKNDTINNAVKKEIYDLDTNKLLYKELHRDKRNINLIYSRNNIFNSTLLRINGKDPNTDILNKAIEVFKNDIEILEVLESHTPTKNVKKDNSNINKVNKLDIAIKDYSNIIDKFKDLKEVCSNLEYYNNLYKNKVREFYRKYKTNGKSFGNYLDNYRYLQWLLNNKDNIKDYKYKAPLKVVYTTKYRINI